MTVRKNAKKKKGKLEKNDKTWKPHGSRERERERVTLLNNKFFVRRILLSMSKISKNINKETTGIDYITVSVCKKALMAI